MGEGRMRGRGGGVETVGGDCNEMGSVTKKKEKNLQPVSMSASLRNSRIKRREITFMQDTKWHKFI